MVVQIFPSKESNGAMSELLEKIDSGALHSNALAEIQTRASRLIYLRESWFKGWLKTAGQESAVGILARIKYFFFDKERSKALATLRLILGLKGSAKDAINAITMAKILDTNASYFDTVEINPLTQKQREACAVDEDATLVIAGAGTGKTSTIVAKIGLLLRTKQCDPEEILAIAFTTKSASELAERLRERLGVEMRVSTFHKLGLDTLSRLEKAKPSLAPFADAPEQKAKFIDGMLAALKDDARFVERLLRFCVYYNVEPKQSWDFKTMSEYKSWLRDNKIMSLDGEPKKSFQECVIANWLILSGVRFEYEGAYEHETKTIEFRQYRPDFYLPDFGIYIEHFGVDKSGKPAPFMDAKKYIQGMDWKRNLHEKHKTNLVETFSWEHSEGILLSNLSAKLEDFGCVFAPISENDALSLLHEQSKVSQFSQMACSFLTLYKNNGNRLADGGKPKGYFGKQRQKLFLELFEQIFEKYEAINNARGQIDFEDMIVKATDAVNASTDASPYRYILIDEFQDISPARAGLINAIRSKGKDCALFAVGDDWQSIYRFAGADIGSMTKFGDVFGYHRQIPLDTTFRFDSQSVEASSIFILKNKAQIPKSLKAVRDATEPSLVIYRRSGKERPLDWCLDDIARQAPSGASVLILERYNFHLPDKPELARLHGKYTHLNLNGMSIHASKGLEADYVLIGMRGGQWGFPSQIVDDPIFDMVLTQADEHPNGEERRLFYVALTRAKRKTYLVCETGHSASEFATEMTMGVEYPKVLHGVEESTLACRSCGSGVLQLRDGSNGKFFGCSNFPLCSNTEQTCCKCGLGIMQPADGHIHLCNRCGYAERACPKCKSGRLVPKSGKFGPFYGCSNFRDPSIHCRHKQ